MGQERNARQPDPFADAWKTQGYTGPTPRQEVAGIDRRVGDLGVKADVNINAAPPGSAIERYYDRLIGSMPTGRQSALGDFSNILGSFASDQRDNRVIKGNFQGDFDRTMLEREAARNRIGLESQTEFDRAKLLSAADKRDSTSDAMQKIQLGGYLQSGGMNSTRPGRGVTDQEKAASTGLIDQMHSQLNRPEYEPTKFSGNYDYKPMDPSQYAQPGMLERAGQWGGAITGGLGILDKLSGGRSGDILGKLIGKIPGLGGLAGGSSSGLGGLGLGFGGLSNAQAFGGAAPANAGGILSKFGLGGGKGPMSFLGKAAPWAGAVTGSLGLMKDRGLASNLMNGVTAGASIGSIVPGLGTAVGAGVGALVGGLRGVFGGPSKQELASRQGVNETMNEITTGATEQQRAEAASAGWEKPEQALASIVLRDKFGPEQGDMIMKQLFSASRMG